MLKNNVVRLVVKGIALVASTVMMGLIEDDLKASVKNWKKGTR